MVPFTDGAFWSFKTRLFPKSATYKSVPNQSICSGALRVELVQPAVRFPKRVSSALALLMRVVVELNLKILWLHPSEMYTFPVFPSIDTALGWQAWLVALPAVPKVKLLCPTTEAAL